MIDKQSISNRLSGIEDELTKLKNIIFALKITDTASYPQNYEELSIDAALRMERLACSFRNIIYAVNLVSKPVLMEKTAEAHGISIQISGGLVEITLPATMPLP